MRFLVLLLTLCLFSPAYAVEITFPALTGRVVDEADILNGTARKQLEQTLAEHERNTSNQIVVVTLDSLQGQEIEEYGYRLGRHWQIGQKGRNNGALLIVVPGERQVRIEVGYGLEPVLTDATSRFIIERAILPHFRKGDYAAGIAAGVDAMMAASAGEFEALPQQPTAAQDENVFPGGLFFFIILLLWIMRRGRRGRYSSGLFWLPLILGSGGGFGGSRGGGGGISFGGGGGSFGGGGASGRW